jgi:DNA replication protein DnaC
MSGKDPSVLLLEHHLKALKLPTVLRDYASLAAVCSQERSSFPQYLLRLVERELIDRERRATERRIKEAAFPVIKTIESFDFKVQPSINEPLVRELLRGEYITKKENVLLVGNAGTGKTHLATALGFAACSQGKRVRFYTTTGLVTQLLEAREERTLQRLLKQLDRQDLVLLDELGYVPFSKAGAELLFDVVIRANCRYSKARLSLGTCELFSPIQVSAVVPTVQAVGKSRSNASSICLAKSKALCSYSLMISSPTCSPCCCPEAANGIAF